jgi:alanine or glycine:cation symporter, AGCS family
MGAALIIILYHYQYIDDAFALIFANAFSMSAGIGGFVGGIIVGFQRAAYSNEAGLGSASIAHAAVKTKFAASEGLVALFEPFIDTVIICTMTALVIILFNLNGVFDYGGINGEVIIKATGKAVSGVDLTSLAFDAVIPNFSYVLTVAVVLFAFSTIISWAYYGIQAWKYLFGKSKISHYLFNFFFIVFIIIGSAAKLDSAVKFADAMMLALVFPNMIGLLVLYPKVKEELNRYLKAIKNAE